jgi:hypothetical protein
MVLLRCTAQLGRHDDELVEEGQLGGCSSSLLLC